MSCVSRVRKGSAIVFFMEPRAGAPLPRERRWLGAGLGWMGPAGSVLLPADVPRARPPPPHTLPVASGCVSRTLL